MWWSQNDSTSYILMILQWSTTSQHEVHAYIQCPHVVDCPCTVWIVVCTAFNWAPSVSVHQYKEIIFMHMLLYRPIKRDCGCSVWFWNHMRNQANGAAYGAWYLQVYTLYCMNAEILCYTKTIPLWDLGKLAWPEYLSAGHETSAHLCLCHT